jgi:type I restriction enzyme R subunit
MKKLASELVQILQGSIGIVDFWSNPAEQARLRGELADALLMADIPEVTASFNRLAVEILKLAKHRHEQLV